MKRVRIGLLLGLSLATACLETEVANNDGDWVPPATLPDAGPLGAGPSLGVNDAAVSAPVGNVGGGGSVGGGGTSTADAGGTPVTPGTGGGGVSAVQQIIGTGKACSTYGLPTNGKCGGVYCAVEPALLERAFQELTNRPNGCNTVPSDLACSGLTARVTAACARKIKSANALASNAELRPKIQACVYEDAEIKAKMPPTCLSCYLDSATCSGDNCLIECLGGDSPSCDKCRLDKGCSRPVADCTGFPNPL